MSSIRIWKRHSSAGIIANGTALTRYPIDVMMVTYVLLFLLLAIIPALGDIGFMAIEGAVTPSITEITGYVQVLIPLVSYLLMGCVVATPLCYGIAVYHMPSKHTTTKTP